MRLALAILLVFAWSGSAFAQTTTGSAETHAPCSPAVTGNNNTFTFTYCGNDPEEQKRIFRLLQAVANGELVTNTKLDEILAILNRPIKITRSPSFPVKAPEGAHPRTAINFLTDYPVDRGQFEVVCNRACTPIDVCRIIGGNSTLLETVSDEPNIAVYRFLRQFPEQTACGLTVESRDDNPVNIIDVRISNRTANLVKNAVQPSPAVAAGGSLLQ
jgi:hypothetical protein